MERFGQLLSSIATLDENFVEIRRDTGRVHNEPIPPHATSNCVCSYLEWGLDSIPSSYNNCSTLQRENQSNQIKSNFTLGLPTDQEIGMYDNQSSKLRSQQLNLENENEQVLSGSFAVGMTLACGFAD